MRRLRLYSRASEVTRVRYQLLRNGFPRVEMFMLVSLTGLSGLLASFLMLHAGLTSMAWRYTLAVYLAYCVFFVLLRGWLEWRRDDLADGSDIPFDIPIGSGSEPVPVPMTGQGGSFDGGGASANWDGDGGSGASPVGEALEGAGSADDLVVPLAVIIFVGAIVLSSLWVVYTAPLLFAEIVVDSLLSASLYRRLQGIDDEHWIRSAVRRTIWPFLITTVVVALCGWTMGHYYPQAHSIGEVLRASSGA